MVDIFPFVESGGGEGSLDLSVSLNHTSSTLPLFILHYSSVCRMLCVLYYFKCQLLLGLTLFTVNLLYSVQHIRLLIKKKKGHCEEDRHGYRGEEKFSLHFFVFSFHNAHPQILIIRDTKMTKSSSSTL